MLEEKLQNILYLLMQLGPKLAHAQMHKHAQIY